MIAKESDYIRIDTPCTTMLLKPAKNTVQLLYYGDKLDDARGCEVFSVKPQSDAHASVDNLDTSNSLFSFFGDGNDKEAFVWIKHGDTNFVSKFEYIGFRIGKTQAECGLPFAHGVDSVLTLQFCDDLHKTQVELYIAAYEDSDSLTFSSRVKNVGADKIWVKRLFSAQIDVDGAEVEILTLDGAWARERQITKNRIAGGSFCIDSKIGSSSNKHNPFAAVQLKNQGGWIAFNPVYSGNHKFVADVSPLGQTRLLSGLNDFMLEYPLESGEEFYAPQTVVLYADTLERITDGMHRFVNRHIVPERFFKKERPVLVNNWEATYFDFDGEKLKSLVSEASRLGIELFVLDDGWFGGRDSDKTSLGDWTDNALKTGGLEKLSAFVKHRGMKFGLWVEPEMVSADSALYRAHPEYAMRLPGARPIERRNQLMLDLVNRDVQTYLIEKLSSMFDICQPDYIKWDCNRTMSDVFSGCISDMGKYFYDYTLSLYGIIEALTKKYPQILFESCSAGGNRYDLGMLCFMPQIWASDNTDARDRLGIQEGTLLAYPQSTMGAHVSAVPNHQTGNVTPLDSRFAVACAGVLGYELDITALSAGESEQIKHQIDFYKKHRKLLQFGVYKRVENSPNYFVQTVTGEDQSEMIVTLIQKTRVTNSIPQRFRLSSALPKGMYLLQIFGGNKTYTVSGDVLNSFGLDLAEFTKSDGTNSIGTCLIYIRRQNPIQP